MKKFLSLFLCLILLFGLLPLTAPARADSSGDWEYEIDEGKATITKYNGSGGSVTVPSSLGGKPVTKIGSYTFAECKSLTSVTIPDSVTEIGDWAFQYCYGLTGVTIPNSVTNIGEAVFYCCYSLTSVTIPDSVTEIGYATFFNCTALTSVTIPGSVIEICRNAFDGCSGLTSVTIPDSVIWIDGGAFYGCTSLTSVTIPNSVTSIDWDVFCGCSGLTSVTIPNSVTSIGESAFSGCSSLTDVTIPESITSIGVRAFSDCTSLTKINVDFDNSYYCSVDGVLFSKDMTKLIAYPGGKPGAYSVPNGVKSIDLAAFSGSAGLTGVIIGSSVTSIGNSAFVNCSNLTSVTLPKSITGISASAFSGCTGLTSMTIPNSVTKIGKGSFSGCTGLTGVTIPDSVTSIGKGSFSGCTGLTDVTIGSSVTKISNNAFEGCSGLTGVTIPDSVTEIGDQAFSNCSGLTGVTIPDSVTSIGKGAFSYCSSLTDVTIPGSVTSIGDSAFFDCTGLTDVTIPSSVTSIGNKAFSYCGRLTDVTIPGSGITSIGSQVFQGCTGLTGVTIGSGVTSIGKEAFSYCRSLTRVTIPDSVTSFDYAFSNCTGLTNVTVGNGVTHIGNYAFSDCKKLTRVTIPDSVTSIGEGAFKNCSGLTDVTIPNRVTSIGDSAFFDCRSLTSVTIPDRVTSISVMAFFGCTGLTSVTIPASVTSIGEGAFYACSSLTGVTIPASVTSIGRVAFWWCSGLTSVTIPASVTSIGEGAFDGCSGLTSVTIPDSVTCISAEAFQNCSGLTFVTIPASVTSINYGAFRNCTGLSDVYYGGSEEDWTEIDINPAENECLLNAAIHFAGPLVITGVKAKKTTAKPSDAITWTATASGGFGPLQYCFFLYKDGTKIQTRSYSTVNTFSYTPTEPGIYKVKVYVKDAADAKEDKTSTGVTVADPPVITTQPGNQTITAGETATFTITATGTGLTYQWQYSRDDGTTWTNKSGATEDSYTVEAKASYDGILYRCQVKNAGGTINSDPAKLSVAAGGPVITTQPENQTVTAGETATFTITATGTGLTYQWQYSRDDGTTWTNKSGATEDSYTVEAKASYDGILYRCQVKNAGGTINSDPAKLSVAAGGPVITTQPENQTVTAGETAAFTVVATGTGLTYQWQYSRDDGTTWTNKSGATEESYTVEAKASYDGILYRCRVKNAGGTINSDPAKLSVAAGGPVITTQPENQTVTAGETAAFTVVATGTGLTYQWQYSRDDGTTWTNKSGATEDSYTVEAKASYDGILYRCRVKNPDGTVYSDPAKLSVTSAGPVISSVKTGVTSAYAGEKITWTAAASGGSGTLKYYFILYKDGVKVKTRSYSTTNTFSYTPAEAGTYKVKVYVKDAEGTKVSKTSSQVAVTLGPPAIISVKAGKTSSAVGEEITWTAAAVGSEQPLKYYFILYKDGAKLKTRSYSTTNTFSYTPTEAGTYKVKVYVKDATGAKIYKNSAKLTVTD